VKRRVVNIIDLDCCEKRNRFIAHLGIGGLFGQHDRFSRIACRVFGCGSHVPSPFDIPGLCIRAYAAARSIMLLRLHFRRVQPQLSHSDLKQRPQSV